MDGAGEKIREGQGSVSSWKRQWVSGPNGRDSPLVRTGLGGKMGKDVGRIIDREVGG